ncbi:AIPR family protein [Spiroplasma endosymbiont of Anurida maritima]|uniref:AIPR family protein n=1 Tax=Spiroplasma endosymbiont of Anurida maritima TaxID=2967972 RepID=UPI0036D2EDDF
MKNKIKNFFDINEKFTFEVKRLITENVLNSNLIKDIEKETIINSGINSDFIFVDKEEMFFVATNEQAGEERGSTQENALSLLQEKSKALNNYVEVFVNVLKKYFVSKEKNQQEYTNFFTDVLGIDQEYVDFIYSWLDSLQKKLDSADFDEIINNRLKQIIVIDEKNEAAILEVKKPSHINDVLTFNKFKIKYAFLLKFYTQRLKNVTHEISLPKLSKSEQGDLFLREIKNDKEHYKIINTWFSFKNFIDVFNNEIKGGNSVDAIFDKNIRLSLGNSVLSKDRVEETFFPVFNNGVKIIAGKVEVNNSNLSFNNMSVLNGQQSVRFIINNEKDLNLETRIPVTIIAPAKEKDFYSETWETFTNKITIASNTQRKVESYELISNDSVFNILNKHLNNQGKFIKTKKGYAKVDKNIKNVFGNSVYNLDDFLKNIILIFDDKFLITDRKKVVNDLINCFSQHCNHNWVCENSALALNYIKANNDAKTKKYINNISKFLDIKSFVDSWLKSKKLYYCFYDNLVPLMAEDELNNMPFNEIEAINKYEYQKEFCHHVEDMLSCNNDVIYKYMYKNNIEPNHENLLLAIFKIYKFIYNNNTKRVSFSTFFSEPLNFKGLK